MKRKMRRTKVDIFYGDLEESSGPLDRVIDFLISKREEGIEKGLVDIQIEFDFRSPYYEIYGYKERPETDKEFKARKRRSEAAKKRAAKKREEEKKRRKKEYLRLKEEFENEMRLESLNE